MAAESVGPMATCHVVAMPSAGRGHINPMMNLCKLLVSRSHHILVTFVVIEEWLGFIGSDPKPDNIRFRTIPNVLPSELVRAANMAAFVEATMTKMEEPFERLLDRLDTPATVIVADAFLNWAVEVGNRRNIPVAALWPMPASVYSLMYHFDLLVQNGHFPIDLSERGEERVEYIPGLSPIRLADLPTIFHVEDKQGYTSQINSTLTAPESFEPMATCHVVAMPYPGRGHVNPMMNLCKILASRSSHILVTVVVTEEWLGFIGSETKPDNVRFSTIPNVLPSELVRAADMVGFLEAVRTKMEEPFERLLDRLETPATVIVADAFFNWAVDVGNRRNIPVASFWVMPASVFSIFYHFDLVVQNGHFPVELSEKGEELVDYIPGLSPIRLADIPTIFNMKDKRLLHKALHLISNVSKSQYLLFSSILELESPVVDALQLKFQFPIYSLGPLIPYFNLEHSNSHTTACHDDPDYFKWLDSQPQNSILYVSLGSFLSVSSTQMDEIVAGLLNSGVRCLMVARDKASTLKEACANAGMVVPWCDQLKVLCHSSVGGFLTHCGWNSTMESIFAGVPMLTLPLMMDQAPNCKFIVEDWKIGWKLKKWGIENLVLREEIADLARAFMDLENPKRKEMMKRSEKMKEICRGAIQKGGSSESNLDAFIKNISK